MGLVGWKGEEGRREVDKPSYRHIRVAMATWGSTYHVE